MAKSQTFGKRENEKKKQAKRLEKQKRREERQAGGSSSLDDMIAYVDENGNITDTPPQLRPKVEIQLEDIVIATPKKEDIAAEPLKGRVEYFNTEKGVRVYQGPGFDGKIFFPYIFGSRRDRRGADRPFRTHAGYTRYECGENRICAINIYPQSK